MSEKILIPKTTYIYRVMHRIMEGDCQYDHGPRPVCAGPFYADKYPVTNMMYYRYLKESNYEPSDPANYLHHWVNGIYRPEDADCPVTYVSQEDAEAYAAFYHCRLPMDYEWQLIASGPDKLLYPWGNTFEYGRCNCESDHPLPVTSFPSGASVYGCMDLCRNTWEWTGDHMDDGMHRFTFLRGGSFYKAPHFWHAEGGCHKNNSHLKFLLLNEGLNRNATIGFRCIQDA